MGKVFEDYFSELQTDMVAICLEYCSNRANGIYIYCSVENGKYTANFFYMVNNKLVKKNKLNEEILNCDVTIETQRQVMKILMDDLQKLEQVCKNFNQPMPTEIKLIYDVNKNSLKAKYQYDIIYSNHPTKTARDIEQEWFDEIENSI